MVLFELSDLTPVSGETIETDNQSDADSYEWFLDNESISTDENTEIDTTLLEFGAHVLTLVGVTGDVPSFYSVPFTVYVGLTTEDSLKRQIRIAISEKLNVPQVTDYCSVHYRRGKGNLPYLVFDDFSGVDNYTFGGPDHEDFIWMVQVFTDDQSHETLGEVELAEKILSNAVSAIGDSLDLGSGETWWVRKAATVRSPNQQLSDRVIHQEGFQLRVVASK